MAVVGLPPAVEMMLTSLLAKDELTSWKVAGEPGVDTVVVLRFRPSDGQPLQASDTRYRGHFRRKPPCQVLRDLKRAQRHREDKKGEQCHRNIVDDAVSSAEDLNVDIPVDGARALRASTSSCPKCPTTLTFAPMCDTAVSTADRADKPGNAISDNVPTNSLTSETISVAADQSSSEPARLLNALGARVDAFLNRMEGTEGRDVEEGGGHAARACFVKPAVDPGESPSTEIVPGRRSDSNHLAPDLPAMRTLSATAKSQTNHQGAARRNKPGDTSGGTCSMKTRSGSAARQGQRRQHYQMLRK